MKLKKLTQLIFALDVEPESAFTLIKELSGIIKTIKIGSRLFTAFGPKIIESAHKENLQVFLDLKFHDIPNTVAQACRQAVKLGVWGLTIHAGGGFGMMKEAVNAVANEAKRIRKDPPLVFGVTVLTSLSDPELKEVGVDSLLPNQVKRLALLAEKAGLDGVVASGNEIKIVREVCGEEFQIAVPGIRSGEDQIGDQKRVMTPARAAQAGANYIIVGRPILEAKDKVAAVQKIQKELLISV